MDLARSCCHVNIWVFLGPIARSLLHGHAIVAPSLGELFILLISLPPVLPFTFHASPPCTYLKLGLGKHHWDRKLAQCSVVKKQEGNSSLHHIFFWKLCSCRHALICDLALWLCSSIFLLAVDCARDTVLQFLLESVWYKRWRIGPKSSSLGLLCLEQ